MAVEGLFFSFPVLAVYIFQVCLKYGNQKEKNNLDVLFSSPYFIAV